MVLPQGGEVNCQGQEAGMSQVEELEGGTICECASVVSFRRVSFEGLLSVICES